MKERFLSLLLGLVLLTLSVLSGCGETPTPGADPSHEHEWAKVYLSDETHHWLACESCSEKSGYAQHTFADKACTVCSYEQIVSLYPWEKTALVLQTSDNSNRSDLTSGSRRYLAGTSADNEDVDALIDNRNAKARQVTNAEIVFEYWPEGNPKHTWSRDINEIVEVVNSRAPTNAPDIYCTFIYDMVGAMIEGCFLNLLSDSMLTNVNATNYFRFLEDGYDPSADEEGFMYEYMSSLTLSKGKAYLVASDYFTDLARAFYAVPVNLTLLAEYGAVTGDQDGDGDSDFDDLALIVERGEWTYELLTSYCDAVAAENTLTAGLDGVVGFALDSYQSRSAAGLLYSSGVEFIARYGNELTDSIYDYPASNATLADFAEKLETLVSAPGVYVATRDDNSLSGIRDAFATDHVLFGGVTLVGSLEEDAYRDMESGFGILPVPLYRSVNPETGAPDPYITQIHNVGRIGAIARTTNKFSQCTAYLSYVSTHSSDILDAYFDTFSQNGLPEENVEMLRLLRANVASGFDKVFEEALLTRGEELESLWHYLIKDGAYAFGFDESDPFCIGSQMGLLYEIFRDTKKDALMQIWSKLEDLKN